ncbi:MAG: Response regulator PleD [Phycisphaerae bacterium]|nr:Response regulator PleD [Phycisphaerae bacterium]
MTTSTALLVKRILIVDDEENVVRALAIRCQQLGLLVDKANNALEALTILKREPIPPDLLLLDFNMPGADGLTLCDMLKTDTTLAPLPVILLTAYDNDQIRRRCEMLGAYYVRKDVDAWKQLQKIISRLLDLPNDALPESAVRYERSHEPASPATSAGKILVIDDDPMMISMLKTRLKHNGYQVISAMSGMQGYWLAIKEEPDLILLDFKMPNAWGNTILGKLKSDPLTRKIPVYIVSGISDLGLQRDVLRLGAMAWITKPFDSGELLKIIQKELAR